MLELKFIRENPELVKTNLEKRHDPEKVEWIGEILKKDELWRKLKKQSDDLRSKRNELSSEINEAKKQGKDIKNLLEQVKEIPGEIEKVENHAEKLQEEIKYFLMRLPNLLHETVPFGKDDSENEVVREFGDKPVFKFPLKSHVDLMMENDWADMERAAKISGARWYFLKNELALLEMAISRYAVDFMIKKGYKLVIPPYMICRKAYEGVTSLADFEEMLYKIDNEDLYLIATSEHPLVSMYMDETLEEKELPIKLIGYSTNFRKEAGAHGKDTKGIFRVHQFNKIEQVIICKPEDSWKLHEELLKNIEDFFLSLGVAYRITNICTGDIGIVAAKKYDLDGWFPVQQQYRELGSCSNCLSYQAVRLNLKYRSSEGNLYAHTLNSTCTATSRALVLIMENFQNKDGSVNIPKVLVPYMNGNSKIGKG